MIFVRARTRPQFIPATGCHNQSQSGRYIPQVYILLFVNIEVSGGNFCEHDSGRSEHPDLFIPLDRTHETKKVSSIIATRTGKAGRKDRLGNIHNFGNTKLLPVHPGPLTHLPAIDSVAGYLVDHAEQRLTEIPIGDRYRRHAEAPREVQCPVKRIDHPQRGVQIGVALRPLFCKNRNPRSLKNLKNPSLGSYIRSSLEVFPTAIGDRSIVLIVGLQQLDTSRSGMTRSGKPVIHCPTPRMRNGILTTTLRRKEGLSNRIFGQWASPGKNIANIPGRRWRNDPIARKGPNS